MQRMYKAALDNFSREAVVGVLAEVRDALDDGNNWTKGVARPKVCLRVAMHDVTTQRKYISAFSSNAMYDLLGDLFEWVIHERFPDRLIHWGDALIAFNDHPNTIWDDVAVLFTKVEKMV